MNRVLSIGMIISSVLFCLSSSHAMRIYNPNQAKKAVIPVKPIEVVKYDTKAKYPPLDEIANDEKALLEAVEANPENFARRLYNTKKGVLKQIPGVVFDTLATKLGSAKMIIVFKLSEIRDADRYLISVGMMHEKGNEATKKIIHNAYRTMKTSAASTYEKDIRLAIIAPDEASDSDDYKSKRYIFAKSQEQKKVFDEIKVETDEPKRTQSAPVTRVDLGMNSEASQKAMKAHWDKVVAKGYNEDESNLSEESLAHARSVSVEREAARVEALKNHYETGMEQEVMKYAKDLDVSEKAINEQKEHLRHVGA